MNEIMIYLLEASGLLILFYSVYFFLLRKEGSLNFNRFYLLLSLASAFLFPFLSFDFQLSKEAFIDEPINQLSAARSDYHSALLEWTYQPLDVGDYAANASQESVFTPLPWVAAIYLVGVIFLLSRLLWMIGWMVKLQLSHPHKRIKGVRVVKLPFHTAPFSFLTSVFVHEPMVETEEFDQILDHEITHLKQRHSFDLLFVQLLAAFIWFNPVIWWLLKSLKSTHEYIADRNMMNKGYSLVGYQALLLRQVISNHSFGLVHHFNLSFIKQRITMMKKEKTGGFARIKVALITIMTFAFGLFMMQCNSNLEGKLLEDEQSVSVDLPEIEARGYVYHSKGEAELTIAIKDNVMTVNGQMMTLDDLNALKGKYKGKTFVGMQIDKNQQMGFVNAVQQELRKLDLRKLIYMAVNNEGIPEQLALQLPPIPGNKLGIVIPELTPTYIQENGIEMFEVDISVAKDYQKVIYDFVLDPKVAPANKVVRGLYKVEDTFEQYLTTISQIKNGYYQIYDERALEMFGKSFKQINNERMTSEEAKERYKVVRAGIPLAMVVDMK